jgi:hypothetical protein
MTFLVRQNEFLVRQKDRAYLMEIVKAMDVNTTNNRLDAKVDQGFFFPIKEYNILELETQHRSRVSKLFEQPDLIDSAKQLTELFLNDTTLLWF